MRESTGLAAAAETGTTAPLVCFSGSPSTAGILLAGRVQIRNPGDFDWPGTVVATPPVRPRGRAVANERRRLPGPQLPATSVNLP
ncbi:DUF2399 domain-containing protein [Nocardia brasiliensis]|uniref:DUF2399 domain-containing protein n=1 Tax=Nocardia brasiliensis TaxID=37326 RepID=UPI00143549F0